MKIPFEGGCLCGRVRYRCEAAPIAMLKCHCRDCQRVSGGPHVCAILVPEESLRFTGMMPTYFCSDSDSGGKHKRGFCGVCGSRLTGGQSPDLSTGFVGLTVGSLDDPSEFRPQMEIWVSHALSWDPIDGKLPSFPKNPDK